MLKKTCFFLLIWLRISAVATAQDSVPFRDKGERKEIERLINNFSGAYSNQAQADTAHHKMLAAQKARIFRIWQTRHPEDYWIYSGWFYAGDDENPFREMIYHVVRYEADTLYLNAYTCVPAFRKQGWVGAEWKESEPFARLSFAELEQQAFNCEYIAFEHEDGYMLRTVPHVCPSNVAGSPFEKIGFELQVYKAGITIRNEYFMKNGTVLKLPQGVIFKLLSRNRKKF